MGISLRPSTFSAGGSLIDDVDVTITRARFCLYDFEGKADTDALCLGVTFQDGDGTDHVQYYSSGDKQYFVPSEDPKQPDNSGKELVQVGEKGSLNGGTNAALFLTSLINAGFDESQVDSGDVSVIEGVNVHVNRVPQPKRNNLPKRPGQSDREPTVLLVTRINEEKVAAKGKAAAAKPGPAAAQRGIVAKPNGKAAGPAIDTNLAEELTGEMVGLFAAKEVSEMKKVDIVKGLFQTVDKGNANRNKLMAAAGKEEYLTALEGFSFNGSILTMEG